MNIHHLNCASMHPVGGRLMRLSTPLPAGQPPMVCHCLLIETDQGLVLVDTGIGSADIAAPRQRLGRGFVAAVRPTLTPAETARSQVEAAGFAAEDVRHILVTHLDLDHAGGLADFPDARVHVLADEQTAAMTRAHWKERERYKAAQWAHDPEWHTYRPDGEAWFGFDCVRELDGLPPEILMVPLAGHSRGHAGIAVQGPNGWLLHAGDAYFYHGEMQAAPCCPRGLRAFQSLVALDNDRRKANQSRLRELANDADAGVRVFCAHDPWEFERHRD